MTDKGFKRIFPLGEKNDAYAQYFVGQSYPVSYTHLDVYKRQACQCIEQSAKIRGGNSDGFVISLQTNKDI